ncbi:MAG: 50S ribosomal protein L35 [Nitrospirae bacterium]|nr:50S ribosomal protein L35 [Nitrospirota bacterium]
MPKMKTHRGAKKRFRATGTGRLKRDHAYTSHIFSGKTRKTKRHHRSSAIVSERDEARMKRLLPYAD